MNYETSIRAAIATSMVNMLFVSSGSVLANKKLNLIIWSVFYQALIPIILGVLTGLFISTSISGKLLNLIFGIFLGLVAIKMIYDSINYKKYLRTEIFNEYNIKNSHCLNVFHRNNCRNSWIRCRFCSSTIFVYFCLPIKEATGTSSAVHLWFH